MKKEIIYIVLGTILGAVGAFMNGRYSCVLDNQPFLQTIGLAMVSMGCILSAYNLAEWNMRQHKP